MLGNGDGNIFEEVHAEVRQVLAVTAGDFNG